MHTDKCQYWGQPSNIARSSPFYFFTPQKIVFSFPLSIFKLKSRSYFFFSIKSTTKKKFFLKSLLEAIFKFNTILRLIYCFPWTKRPNKIKANLKICEFTKKNVHELLKKLYRENNWQKWKEYAWFLELQATKTLIRLWRSHMIEGEWCWPNSFVQ